MRTLAEQKDDLPDWRLDHLMRMSDATGMLQHATRTIPNYEEGYCTDDNARALLLTVFLEELGQSNPEIDRLASRYAAFLQAAFNTEVKRFRNFLGFRPPLVGKDRIGGFARAGGSGHWAPASGVRDVPTCRRGRPSTSSAPPGDPGNHLPARPGRSASRHSRIPPSTRWRPARRPGARYPRGPVA